MNKVIGITSAALAIIIPGIFLYYMSNSMMDSITHIVDWDIILFLIASILLLIGVIKYERYDRYKTKKKSVLKKKEPKKGRPCPECNSPMIYVDEWGRWYCENCDKYR